MKLRDQRNGGWFWAQNELFDVFQPLIGVHGVSVYMAMCRKLGDPKTNGRLSLRDIAEAAGVSKSEVGRQRTAMVALGMIAEKVTGAKTSSTFDLLDLRAAAEVGPEELQRRLTLSQTRELPSETVPGLKAGTVQTVPTRDSLEHNRQYLRGSPQKPAVPPRDSLAVPQTELSPGGDSFAAQSELFNTETNTRERECARARGDADILDLQAIADLIVVTHPRSQLRSWTRLDVSDDDRSAVIEAAQAEAQLVGSSPEDAAVGILDRVRTIAREVPRDQWRFLKEVALFMRRREYRAEPRTLYRATESSPKKRPDAGLGISTTPRRDEAEERAAALNYWRTMRERGLPIYGQQAPGWARRLLDVEAAAKAENKNPAA